MAGYLILGVVLCPTHIELSTGQRHRMFAKCERSYSVFVICRTLARPTSHQSMHACMMRKPYICAVVSVAKYQYVHHSTMPCLLRSVHSSQYFSRSPLTASPMLVRRSSADGGPSTAIILIITSAIAVVAIALLWWYFQCLGAPRRKRSYVVPKATTKREWCGDKAVDHHRESSLHEFGDHRQEPILRKPQDHRREPILRKPQDHRQEPVQHVPRGLERKQPW